VAATVLATLGTAFVSTPPARAEAVLTRVQVPRRDRVVALTFDDGPDPRYTAAVLADLARFHDHATFFLEGQFVQRHPELARAEVAAGDELGNHTYDHRDLRGLDPAAARREIDLTKAAFAQAGLPPAAWFRPPKGHLRRADARVVRAEGLETVLWTRTMCVELWTRHHPATSAMRLMLERVRPGEILLAHDGGIPDRRATLRALPSLLAGLHAEGYRVVTVSELVRA
jgi:peptidoglycan/xylan/chitin deacetylase (PgdA/CDA1 family)